MNSQPDSLHPEKFPIFCCAVFVVVFHHRSLLRFFIWVITCEGVGDVVGVKAPLGGVAQVIFHGVQVVEVGVQVRVHQDRGVEEDGEGQVEIEKGGRRGQRENAQKHGVKMR